MVVKPHPPVTSGTQSKWYPGEILLYLHHHKGRHLFHGYRYEAMPADDDDADSGTQRTAVFWIVGVPLRFTSNEHGRAGS